MRRNRKTARLAVTPHEKLSFEAVLPRFCSYAAVRHFNITYQRLTPKGLYVKNANE